MDAGRPRHGGVRSGPELNLRFAGCFCHGYRTGIREAGDIRYVDDRR
jgi:hypothetical protein